MREDKNKLNEVDSPVYEKKWEKWSSFVGVFCSLLGIVVSILTCISSPSNVAIAASVVGCQIMILVFCILSIINYRNNKKMVETIEANSKIIIDKNKHLLDDLEQKYKFKEVFTDKLSLYYKSINKRINNFLTLICDESDRYFAYVYSIKGKYEIKKDDDIIEQCKIELEEQQNKYKESLCELFRRYIRGVFEEILKILIAYLKSRNLELNVSVTLKLFEETYNFENPNQRVKIYTAFRDKETYDIGEREVGRKQYSIDLNGDFHNCLSKECYIRNNIKENDDDYLNENFPESLRHYNCTVVVPIICDYKRNKQVYGFLCCDTLNHKYDEEVFDKKVANILYATSLTIGTFLDTLNSSWGNIISDESPDILPYLYKRMYKG